MKAILALSDAVLLFTQHLTFAAAMILVVFLALAGDTAGADTGAPLLLAGGMGSMALAALLTRGCLDPLLREAE